MLSQLSAVAGDCSQRTYNDTLVLGLILLAMTFITYRDSYYLLSDLSEITDCFLSQEINCRACCEHINTEVPNALLTGMLSFYLI